MTDITLKVRALDKLIDYVASGVGAIAGPLLAPWRASQEGKARVIAAKANVEVKRIEAESENSTSQLIAEAQAEARRYVATSNGPEPDGSVRISHEDVQNAMEFQAEKRLNNVRAIAGHAAEELGDTEVTDHDPDPDWIARFFDGAQDVSSEELQKLWGRILAGEVKSPGQTSLRTLSILRDMTQSEAQDFSKLTRFRIITFIFDKGVQKVLGKHSTNLMVHFTDIGLLHSSREIYPNITMANDGSFTTEHCGHILIIQGQPGQQLYEILKIYNTSLITAAGLELAELCQHEPDFQYLSHFAGVLAKQDCKLKLARIVGRDNNNFQVSDIRIIEPFGHIEKSPLVHLKRLARSWNPFLSLVSHSDDSSPRGKVD